MVEKLTIQERLKDLRIERHLTLEQLAEQTKLSRSALGKYEAEDFRDISPFSIITLANFYGVSTDYLLGLTEQKNHPDTALEELHLSDEMIALLKSGRINNRLLCEMAAHPDFAQMMADIEIYTDGIASMQIRNLNSVVDMARQEILHKYHPESEDLYLQTLSAARIREERYFSVAIHDDMDAILRGIRSAHAKDSDSAPETSIGEELKKSIEEAAAIEGSAEERKTRIFCRQLGIDYEKLAPDEFAVLIKALSRSKLLKSGVNQRGRVYRKRRK